jgi:hypothetical protein
VLGLRRVNHIWIVCDYLALGVSRYWAFVALVSVNIMALTSATSMRQTSYRLFICTHVIGFVLFLTAVCDTPFVYIISHINMIAFKL